jgi:dCMP deaminase
MNDKQIMRCLQLARLTATLSTCSSKHAVGAVLYSDGVVHAKANGVPSAMLPCDVPAALGARCIHDSKERCVRAVHAEVRVLLAAARHGTHTAGASMFLTLPPCENCVRFMIDAGIKEVFYIGKATSSQGLELAYQHMGVYNLHKLVTESVFTAQEDIDWLEQSVVNGQLIEIVRAYGSQR